MPSVRRDVRYGPDAILRTPRVVDELGARRVLLVCGRRSFEASGAARMLPELERMATVRRFSDFAPNTDAADLARGLALANEFQPDLVLGIGGGSALDMAKLLAACPPATPDVHHWIRSGEKTTSRDRKLVLAPTTSGSGSETTHFAVVYIGDQKFSMDGPSMRPDVAILDPTLAGSGSSYQRATSGVDAVAQAIEGMWAVGATDQSRRYARHALGLLLPAIEPFVLEPTEASARAMAIGSHLAGRAIDISKTTAAHALSYGITKRYGISHGHAVALTLGAFIEAHAADPARLRAQVDPITHASTMAEILSRFDSADGTTARARFAALLRRIGLTPSLSEVGLEGMDARRDLAATVNVERLGNNPVHFDLNALMAVLGEAETTTSH